MFEIHVLKIGEFGYTQALYGFHLSKRVSKAKSIQERWIDFSRFGNAKKRQKIATTAFENRKKNFGHNKYLEQIITWWSVNAPRYVWQEMDTYRLSSKSSESTMHTCLKSTLTKKHFECEDIDDNYLSYLNSFNLNSLILDSDLVRLKRYMPEGFMQERMWVLSYKTLANIRVQRQNHKLPHWQEFIKQIIKQVDHPELLQ